ncbi:hypothetical protein CEXT_619021 [Caerostris extrusa]|uniref:LAGLIDADG homing endonuclease n=1 Tax=Caerostris extrusa TaxID=172846 RepID=A0AAV4T292_CAEEX|nr:hypothetical protein CEXT_619021 [Caerostris extrusa]
MNRNQTGSTQNAIADSSTTARPIAPQSDLTGNQITAVLGIVDYVAGVGLRVSGTKSVIGSLLRNGTTFWRCQRTVNAFKCVTSMHGYSPKRKIHAVDGLFGFHK